MRALAAVKDRDNRTPPEIFELLLDCLKNNDNTQNKVKIKEKWKRKKRKKEKEKEIK